MATITLTKQQAVDIAEAIDVVLSSQVDFAASLSSIFELEKEKPGLVALARELFFADLTDSVEVEITDVAAAMRGLREIVEYHQEAADGNLGEIVRGPVCKEDAEDYPAMVESALSRSEEVRREGHSAMVVLGQLGLLRARELEFRPLAELGKLPVPAAEAQFMGLTT